MRYLKSLVAALVLALAAVAVTPAVAGDTDPLFVNVTSAEPHRARMALMFAANQLARKHPATIFLNDKAVALGSKKNAKRFAEHQKILADFVKAGGTVIACPLCMAHYKVAEGDLVDGAKVGNPELTGALLFKDNTKTLSW